MDLKKEELSAFITKTQQNEIKINFILLNQTDGQQHESRDWQFRLSQLDT